VTSELGWRYHHLGIPTDKPRADEKYIPHLKMYVSGFDTSLYGIEWMRFEKGCTISDLVQTVPHIAFEVDDLEKAISNRETIDGISSPSQGVRVAMIFDNGVPIELIEFRNNDET
jgi:hypothetical protein